MLLIFFINLIKINTIQGFVILRLKFYKNNSCILIFYKRRCNTMMSMLSIYMFFHLILMLRGFSSHGDLTESSSAQMSPASLRRQSNAPWDKPLSSSVSSSVLGSSPASSTILLPDVPGITRKNTNPSASGTWNAANASTRRLSRTVHMSSRTAHSEQSSRSTSRSRSPLPPLSLICVFGYMQIILFAFFLLLCV